MAAIEITSLDDLETMKANFKLIVIDFYATWCGPCKMLAPVIEDLSTKVVGSVAVCKCDVDQVPDLASKYGVMSIPTVAFIDSTGTMVDKNVGYTTVENLLDLVDIIKEKVRLQTSSKAHNTKNTHYDKYI
jgi:thioredoxin 1